MAKETVLAQAFVELADTLVDDFDVADLLIVLSDRCVDVLDVDAAGILLAGPHGRLRVMASTSEAMRTLELFELQAEEGPCFDCYRTGEPSLCADVEVEVGRWPRFSAVARGAGFHATHALPLRLRGTIIGALNLFHADRGDMAQADLNVGQAMADVAAIAILQHRAAQDAQVLNEQLNHALTTRIVIEQAKGMVAERRRVDMHEAFASLRRYARNNNLRLADVARDVTEGRLDTTLLPRT